MNVVFDNRIYQCRLLEEHVFTECVQLIELHRVDPHLCIYGRLQHIVFVTLIGYYLDAANAQAQFKSACASVESSSTSYDLLNEQFNVGLRNMVELMEGKNKLLQAEQNKLQSKYTAIMNEKLLEFYGGESINL